MIVYGTRTTQREGGPLAAPCPQCGRPALRGLRLFTYAHVYGVPTLPFGSLRGLQCESCLHAQVGSEVSEELAPELREATRELRRPRWHWVGTLLLAGLLVWLSHNGARRDAFERAHLAAPEVGDVYVIDLRGAAENVDPEMPFVVARVDAVSADRVRVRLGSWVYDTSWDALKAVRHDRHETPDYWSDQVWPLERAQLLPMEAERRLDLAEALTER